MVPASAPTPSPGSRRSSREGPWLCGPGLAYGAGPGWQWVRTARGMGGWLGGAWASLWVPRAHPHKPPFPPRQLVTGYGFVVISADDAADTVSENEFLTPHLVGPVHGGQLSEAPLSAFSCSLSCSVPAVVTGVLREPPACSPPPVWPQSTLVGVLCPV